MYLVLLALLLPLTPTAVLVVDVEPTNATIIHKYVNADCVVVEQLVGGRERALKCWPHLAQPGRRFPTNNQYVYDTHFDVPAIDLDGLDMPTDIVQGTFDQCVWWCAIFSDANEVRCWGCSELNVNGLGLSSYMPLESGNILSEVFRVNVGTDVLEGQAVRLVATGGAAELNTVGPGFHTCVVFGRAEIKCWGHNRFGILGMGNRDYSIRPASKTGTFHLRAPEDPHTLVQLVLGSVFGCGLFDDGLISCWGSITTASEDAPHVGDDPYELGENATRITYDQDYRATQMSGGWRHVCVLLEHITEKDQKVRCFGSTIHGAFGVYFMGDLPTISHNLTESSLSLLLDDITPDNPVVQLHAFDISACALFQNGTATCWGDLPGYLFTFHQNPQVHLWPNFHPERAKITQISSSLCFLHEDNQLYCTGRNLVSVSRPVESEDGGPPPPQLKTFGWECPISTNMVDNRCRLCDPGSFGPNCAQPVDCSEDTGVCEQGSCWGVSGDGECTACVDDDHHGLNCASAVSCDRSNGLCGANSCHGPRGKGVCDACRAGAQVFGEYCNTTVPCNLDGAVCTDVGGCSGVDGTGVCDACSPGFFGPRCDPVPCFLGDGDMVCQDDAPEPSFCSSASRRGGICKEGSCYGLGGSGRCDVCIGAYFGMMCNEICDASTSVCVPKGECTGVLGTGQCTECQQGFFGELCAPVECNENHGVCAETECWGLRGDGHCTTCSEGWFGDNCDQRVSCDTKHGTCVDGDCFGVNATGTCTYCDDPHVWSGNNCDEELPPRPSNLSLGLVLGFTFFGIIGTCTMFFVQLRAPFEESLNPSFHGEADMIVSKEDATIVSKEDATIVSKEDATIISIEA